eukprot:1732432-Pyramimonas_sp.AAC.1
MKYQGVAAKGGSLYGILEALIKCNLGKPDAPANEDELLEIMAIRMVESVSNQNATLETFMHVEGANLLFSHSSGAFLPFLRGAGT